MLHKSEVSIGTWPTPDRVVRLTLPATVAYDLASFQKVLGSIAERLGCPQCLSGIDCTFQLERDFVVDPRNLAVESIAPGGVVITDG